MLFLLDQCVPQSAAETIRFMNYKAEKISDHIPPDSPDQLVVATADAAGAVLLSADRDFKRLISRRPDGQSPRFKRVHLVKMDCKPMRIKDRLIASMPIVESELRARAEMKDQRLIIWVATDFLKVFR